VNKLRKHRADVIAISFLIIITLLSIYFMQQPEPEIGGCIPFRYSGVKLWIRYDNASINEKNLFENLTSFYVFEVEYVHNFNDFGPTSWDFDIRNMSSGEFDGKRRLSVEARNQISPEINKVDFFIYIKSDNPGKFFWTRKEAEKASTEDYLKDMELARPYFDDIEELLMSIIQKPPSSVIISPMF
jgi:hypothetical protein